MTRNKHLTNILNRLKGLKAEIQSAICNEQLRKSFGLNNIMLALILENLQSDIYDLSSIIRKVSVKMKKVLCLILSVLMIIPFSFISSAQDGKTGTLKMLAYNVSGIPLVGDFQGSVFTTTNDRAAKIGALLNSTDVDFIGVEEDFNGHKYLAAEMTDYPYR